MGGGDDAPAAKLRSSTHVLIVHGDSQTRLGAGVCKAVLEEDGIAQVEVRIGRRPLARSACPERDRAQLLAIVSSATDVALPTEASGDGDYETWTSCMDALRANKSPRLWLPLDMLTAVDAQARSTGFCSAQLQRLIAGRAHQDADYMNTVTCYEKQTEALRKAATAETRKATRAEKAAKRKAEAEAEEGAAEDEGATPPANPKGRAKAKR